MKKSYKKKDTKKFQTLEEFKEVHDVGLIELIKKAINGEEIHGLYLTITGLYSKDEGTGAGIHFTYPNIKKFQRVMTGFIKFVQEHEQDEFNNEVAIPAMYSEILLSVFGSRFYDPLIESINKQYKELEALERYDKEDLSSMYAFVESLHAYIEASEDFHSHMIDIARSLRGIIELEQEKEKADV